MESSAYSESHITGSLYRSSPGLNGDRIAAIRSEMEYLNTIGKRFVAAFDRFQVHRALLAALQELYTFSACSILLKEKPFELSIIPCYPLSASFLHGMFSHIASAANALDFPSVTAKELEEMVYLDAPDELSTSSIQNAVSGDKIRDFLNIPLTVENRIIGMISLFDEHTGTFDTDLLRLTTMIADYAAVSLENVRLRERENELWRQAEMERQRLALIISSMAEGLLITDEQGIIVSLNTSAKHLLAHISGDIVQGIPLRTLATTSSVRWLPKLAQIIDSALAGQTVMNSELLAGESHETVPLTLSISAAPLHDASQLQSRPTGVVAVLNDITSSKQVEKLKDEFVSIVSHELRTPLTGIKGYTQYVIRRIERRIRAMRKINPERSLEDMPESVDIRNLTIVQSQAEQLERLVNGLLDLSRVQLGKLYLHYTSFYLADLLAEQVNSVQASAEQHHIHLTIAAQNTKIVADPQRIGQAIGNILDNAVKYSPQGGQIMVNLEKQGTNYLISISDQGQGVSQEQRDHVFERFYRVHHTANRPSAGIGLGMYVTRAIIEEHSGRIWFSTSVGSGTTFYVVLPELPSHERRSMVEHDEV